MPIENDTTSANPYLFSRGSLLHTFDLIRKKNPQLALQVRNITGGTAVAKIQGQPDNKHTDHFIVELDSFQVRAIVEILMQYGENPDTGDGSTVVARTLLEDWMRLAHKMISELPDSPQP